MVGRDGALVAEEEVDVAPVYSVSVVAGQDLVSRLRGRAPGEHDGEATALVDGLPGPGGELAGGGLREFFGTLVDVDAHRSSISTAVRKAAS